MSVIYVLLNPLSKLISLIICLYYHKNPFYTMSKSVLSLSFAHEQATAKKISYLSQDFILSNTFTIETIIHHQLCHARQM